MSDSNTLYFTAVMIVVAIITAAVTVRTIEYADQRSHLSTQSTQQN
jgi:hypothetical protein